MVDAVPTSLLARCRMGDLGPRQGELLALCRNYLQVLARARIDKNLRIRCDDSDLVQETLMEALRIFPALQGPPRKSFWPGSGIFWFAIVADQVKRNKAQGRNWQRQESLEEMIDRSCQAVQKALGTGHFLAQRSSEPA